MNSNMLQYLVLIGAAVSLIGCLSYVRETLRGKTRPNRVSWLMWSIAPMIASAAGLASGVTWAVLPVFMSGFGPFLILLSSFSNKSGYWKLETFDYLCGSLSLLALILWAVTHDPSVAIIFAIASDASAAVPTLKKAWQNPNTETYGPYIGGLFSVSTGFFAISSWTFAAFAFPAYLFLINIALMTSIWHGNRMKPSIYEK